MTNNLLDEIEYEIKSVDVVLRLLRSDSSAADAPESKLAIQKRIRHIEGIRARLRRRLFDAMDEADAHAQEDATP